MKKRILSVLLSLAIVVAVLPATKADAAANSFTKTGDLRQDIVNAALAQQGKKVADFGYDGMPVDNWCAYFIC